MVLKKVNRAFILALAMCLIISPLFFMSACGMPNYDNLVISNWENYTGLGVGTVSDGSSSSTTLSLSSVSASSGSKKGRLFGVNKDGNYEEITFGNENGSTTQQTMNIVNFKTTELFTFVQFRTDEMTSIGDFYSQPPYENYPLYLIDNKTGKMYNLGEQFNVIHIAHLNELVTSNAKAYMVASTLENRLEEKLFSFEIENGQLKISELFDTETLNGSYLVDNYDNVFIGDWSADNQLDSTFIYKDGQLKNFEYSIFKAANGLVYSEDECQVVNAQGEKENSTCTLPTKEYFYNTDLITTIGNTKYYLIYDTYTRFCDSVAKITYLDETNFMYQKIDLQDYTEKYVIANDRVYFLDNNEIFYVNCDTGEKTTLRANYAFSNIYSDNQGNIIFEGLDFNLNSVRGMITADDQITENIINKGYDVYYIAPIN